MIRHNDRANLAHRWNKTEYRAHRTVSRLIALDAIAIVVFAVVAAYGAASYYAAAISHLMAPVIAALEHVGH